MNYELLQQALDALETILSSKPVRDLDETICAIRTHLAAPQPEPWKHDCAALCTNDVELWVDACPHCGKPRTAPPAAPAPAVPLTDDMVEAEFVGRGDDKGQGLHPYWKDAFREGFNFARSQLSAAPVVPTISPLALRALRMADMALASWENGYAFDSHGPGREAQRLVTDALALSAAPVVREPQYWCPETGELCGKCAKTGTCEASILQAHGIGGGGNG